MPFSKTLVSRRKVAAARALCSAISIEASIAPSIRWKATRLPPESTTATFIFQSRFLASATTALIAALARSSDIGGPKGTSNGMFSGTTSRGFGANGRCPLIGLAATTRFFLDIMLRLHCNHWFILLADGDLAVRYAAAHSWVSTYSWKRETLP